MTEKLAEKFEYSLSQLSRKVAAGHSVIALFSSTLMHIMTHIHAQIIPHSYIGMAGEVEQRMSGQQLSSCRCCPCCRCSDSAWRSSPMSV